MCGIPPLTERHGLGGYTVKLRILRKIVAQGYHWRYVDKVEWFMDKLASYHKATNDFLVLILTCNFLCLHH